MPRIRGSFYLAALCIGALALAFPTMTGMQPGGAESTLSATGEAPRGDDTVTLFLAGDVMTGRAIDQVLPHPVDPVLYEPWVRDARDYVTLAETVNGRIDRPVSFDYIWGDALAELARMRPAARIVNLETSITTNPKHWPGKSIQYRMHPRNIGALQAAKLDVCTLANNHVLDWRHAGLVETLHSLEAADIGYAGAGTDLAEAEQPALVALPGGGRVIALAFGLSSSGIPAEWAATSGRAGVHRLPDLSPASAQHIAQHVAANKRAGDIVVASVHWGANWGYHIPASHVAFAHRLIDDAGVDVVFGHSSHHPLGLEVYRGKLVVYGAGDLLNDYEGIGDHREYRGELSLMYFPRLERHSGKLLQLAMTPMHIRKLRLNRASPDDAAYLADVLAREGSRFGTGVRLAPDNTLQLEF